MGAGDEVLGKLLADSEIREVLARYVRGIDRLDRDLIRSCYHDGAVDRHGMFEGTADEFVAWVVEYLQRFTMTMHFQAPSLVELAAPGAAFAVAETPAIALHRAAGGPQRDNWVSGFRYVDVFERRVVPTSGRPEWRIRERAVVGEWISRDPIETHVPFGAGLVTGRRDRSDKVYEALARCRDLASDTP